VKRDAELARVAGERRSLARIEQQSPTCRFDPDGKAMLRQEIVVRLVVDQDGDPGRTHGVAHGALAARPATASHLPRAIIEIAWCGHAATQTPQPSQRASITTTRAGKHGTSIVVQYCTHLAHPVFPGSTSARVGHVVMQIPQPSQSAWAMQGIVFRAPIGSTTALV
jgi:hypothetical protein